MHKFPSDEEIRKIFKNAGPSAGMPPMPPMPSPEEINVEFYPLLEFEVARRLAKELGMFDEQRVLEQYIKDRIKRMTEKIMAKPKPMT